MSEHSYLNRKDFDFDRGHVLERLAERYRDAGEPARILERMETALKCHTPLGWRFTESPSSRFFVLDQDSGAKFLGLSYRHSPRVADVLKMIGDRWDDYSCLISKLDNFVTTYIDEIKRIDLPICHHIRTVYPKRQKGEIAEEKTFSRGFARRLPTWCRWLRAG